MTVSVEIESSTGASHPQVMKEIQDISVATDVQLEKTAVTVTNADGKLFILNYQNPVTLKSWATKKINIGCSAGSFKNFVKGFYWNTYRSDISVTKTSYDAAGAVTAVGADMVKHYYEITLLKMIAAPSTANIQAIKVDTRSTIAVTLPINLQLSGTPISGKYHIQCINDKGEASTTREIKYNERLRTVQFIIQQDCHQVREAVEILPLKDYRYPENGIGMRLRFIGLDYNPGQYTIIPGNVTVLAGVNLVPGATTVVPFGSNIMYEPIPFEMLKTFETKP